MWSPTYSSDELYHHGILGMKWGVRRYQNKDGTLTAAGKKKYYKEIKKVIGKKEPYSVKKYSSSDKEKLTNLTKESLSIEQKKRLKNANDKIIEAGKTSRAKYTASKKEVEAIRNFHLEREKVMREVLGEYGNKKINTFSLDDTTYGKEVIQAIDWKKVLENGHSAQPTNKRSNRKAIAKKKGLSINPSDSSVTKRVKKDYKELNDNDFMKKYKVSKDEYYKRVQKYGDPYMNSPLAKAGKALNKAHNTRIDRQSNKLQKDIDSFKGYENGIYDKNGRQLLSKEDVEASVSALEKAKEKNEKKRWY